MSLEVYLAERKLRLTRTFVVPVLGQLGLEVGDYHGPVPVKHKGKLYTLTLEGYGAECVPHAPAQPHMAAYAAAVKWAEEAGQDSGVFTTNDDDVWYVAWHLREVWDQTVINDLDPETIIELE